MKAYAPVKGIPRKPMRVQLRSVPRKIKTVRVDQNRRHGIDFKPYRKIKI